MSEDELRAALEELASMPVEQLLVGTIQTLVNVTLLRLGLVEGIEGAADRDQARIAIDAIAALEAVVGPRMPPDVANELRSVLASLRLAYANAGGDGGDEGGGGPPPPPPPPPEPERPPIWTPRGNV
ncbi:MAG: hypothetical protein QOE98_1138 [Gaiellaceae bacterium]|jgi:hypothetical protein|nr:hypothetical protein [Gaiellaceae bacterium]